MSDEATLRKESTPLDAKPGESHENVLDRIRTAGSVVIPPELFETLYLSPENKVKGDLRQTFANPTPMALGGFLLCTTPLSMVLLGWRGSGGLGAATTGCYFFLGGLLLLIGGLLEWVLGNTFPATVFTTFGGFWFTFGATLVPSFNAYGAYSPDPSDLAKGMNAEFYSSFSFFLIAMGMLCLVYLIASVRTNICFFFIFLLLVPTFSCLSAAFFQLALGNAVYATTLQHAGAAMLFAVTMIGWYIFLVLMLLGVDFPIILPLGDLSTVVKGYSQRAAARKDTTKDA